MQLFGSEIKVHSVDLLRYNENDPYPVSVVNTNQGSFVVVGVETVKTSSRTRYCWVLKPGLKSNTEEGSRIVTNKYSLVGHENATRLKEFKFVGVEILPTSEIYIVCDLAT